MTNKTNQKLKSLEGKTKLLYETFESYTGMQGPNNRMLRNKVMQELNEMLKHIKWLKEQLK